MPDKGFSPKSPDYLLIGQFLRPHGIQGEMKMRLLTSYPERLAQLKTVYLSRDPEDPKPAPREVKRVRFHQEYALVTLNDVADRTQADGLREYFVMVPIAEAVPLDEGEYYLFQVIGLRVQTVDGEELGSITEVLQTGANDVYIVESPQHGEILIPVTPDTLVKTDLDAGILIVNLPDGLLP
ncbi:MAG: 16S rRNA processing protein RimM [Anaerolineae bacterium]|nr:16S rRNA processing protein RimM [Anaerolineae bacterium]